MSGMPRAATTIAEGIGGDDRRQREGEGADVAPRSARRSRRAAQASASSAGAA